MKVVDETADKFTEVYALVILGGGEGSSFPHGRLPGRAACGRRRAEIDWRLLS
jgi:hypothetical protein